MSKLEASVATSSNIPKQGQEYALLYLQSVTTVHGISNADTTLADEKQSKIKMYASEFGAIVSRNNITALIPWANIKAAVLK